VGRTTGCHRLSRSGDNATTPLYIVTMVRARHHPLTRVPVKRSTAEGVSKRQIIRCLKRYIAREVYSALPRSGQPAVLPRQAADVAGT
jgi:hypothetical protein